jgi:hypothetical protein
LVLRRYAAHNGSLLTTICVREPTAHIRSHYKMWPPTVPARGNATSGTAVHHGQRVTALPFGTFLRERPAQATGLLTRELLELPAARFNCTAADVEAARRRLAAFDVVGVLQCTRRYWRALGRRLRWTNLVDEQIMSLADAKQHNEYYKPSDAGALRKFVEVEADAQLSADDADALRHASACDAPLWTDGLRLAGLLAEAPGDGPEPGHEAEWAEEQGADDSFCEAA